MDARETVRNEFILFISHHGAALSDIKISEERERFSLKFQEQLPNSSLIVGETANGCIFPFIEGGTLEDVINCNT